MRRLIQGWLDVRAFRGSSLSNSRRVSVRSSALALVLAGAWGLNTASPAQAATSVLTPSPAVWDFGNQDIHSGGTPGEVFTFTNDTGDNVGVAGGSLTGSDAADFQITADTCTGAFLPPLGSCTVQVAFVPAGTGPVMASLEIDDDTGTLDVALAGTGITGTLTSDPNPLVFQPEPYYDGGEQQNITITDSNDAGTLATAGTITGPDASMFYIAGGGNCVDQLYSAANQCDMNIGFNPPSSVGTFTATLEISSDSGSGPLDISLSATTLNGPDPVMTPAQLDFGDVAVGSSAVKTVTVSNEGDAPMQVQEAFVVSGTPLAFPITADDCPGQVIYPGSSCQFTVRFEPTTPGYGEGAVLVINGNTPGPVTPIGVTGTGVSPPSGAATVSGTAADGSRIMCEPVGYPTGTTYSYQWLRNGRALPGVTSAAYVPGVADVGSELSCRVDAGDPVGEQTVTSPPSARVAAMDLSRLSGSFVDEGTCRTVEIVHRLAVGARAVSLSYPQPSLPWAPLVLTARRALIATIDGKKVGAGPQVTIAPQILAAYDDGEHTLSVTVDGRSAKTPLVLAPCRLALRVDGGPGQSALVVLASRNPATSATIRLPPTLRFRVSTGRLGYLSYQQAGYPARTFDVVGARTTSNNVTVTINGHVLRITNLPALTGVIRFAAKPGVLVGTGGTVRASSTPDWAGAILPDATTGGRAQGELTSSVPATWLP